MKEDLMRLVENIEEIKKKFHSIGGQGMPSYNIIHDDLAFSAWKQEVQLELQDIHDRTRDRFIWGVLVITRQGFDGWSDEKSFNELQGSLQAIYKNIDKYYPQSNQGIDLLEESQMVVKKPKIFISHATTDKSYASALVNLLEDIGLRESQIFCSSVSGYGIPLGEDIYEYLKKQFNEFDLHIILVLSNHYYESVACMNEMGAAWVLQKRYTTILLPGFEFKEIKGAINVRKIGLKLDNDLNDVKEKLGQLRDIVIEEFGLEPIRDIRWEERRDDFIETLSQLRSGNTRGKDFQANSIGENLSDESTKLLRAAANEEDGSILKAFDLEGERIIIGDVNFIPSQNRREVAKWESALMDLLDKHYIEVKGAEGNRYVVCQRGYEYVDNNK